MPSRRLLIALLACLLVAPPVRAEDDDGSMPKQLRAQRVFRSVLDGNARMITIRLGDNLWAAYDAEDCHLYKVWEGDVKFDGAVYTTVHGPQPSAGGVPYLTSKDPAWYGADGKPLPTRYLGYRLTPKAVVLRYEVKNDRRIFVVEETLTTVGQGSEAKLRRALHIAPTPRDNEIALILPAGFLSPAAVIGRPKGDRGHPPRAWRLTPDGSTMEALCSIDRVAARAAAVKAAQARKAEEDAKAAKEKADDDKPAVQAHPTNTPLGHGVSVRVYWIGESMSRLRKLVKGQTPNVSHVLPVLDLRTERKDFGDVEDEFITHVDGFLQIETAGTYEFQLTSDDGSRMTLDGKLVIDHDGLHGSTTMTGKVDLEPGAHPLFVEHFENGGGEQLTLEWKPPGATAWAIVPNAALRAPTGEVRVTSPGKKKVEAITETGTPGHGRPLTAVHPSYDLRTARPPDFKPRVGGMDWLPDGRLILCCWEPLGGVYILDGVTGENPRPITVKRIASGLAEPLGLQVVDGRIFVLQKQELTELIDRDGDEIIDEYRCVAAGWGVTANFHEFAFGLVHKDAHFYAALATAINPGGASTQPQNPDRGKVVKIAMGGSFEYVAQGLRTPNGIGIGVDDEIFITDNQGDWLPVSKVLHLTPNAFFGGRSVDFEGTAGLKEQPPVVWLPQGEIGNSPGQPGVLRGGPFDGQMLHADVTHGGLKRVFVEKVRGQYQGCVFRFTQGLEAGINRWTQGPDGALYVGGIGSSGNWGQEGKLKYGLQRLAYNGKPVFEMLSVEAVPERRGFKITFTRPLDDRAGTHPEDFVLRQWRYEPTKNYGGPKLDEEALRVTGVARDTDKRAVTLEVEGLRHGHVVHIRLARTIRDEQGRRPWSSEAWYTLNQTDGSEFDEGRMPPRPPDNVLSEEEKRAGWELLFDGTSLDKWRGYKGKPLPGAWGAEGETLHFTPGKPGGDIVTKETFRNFELRLEWKVAPGGNSGVCYRIAETGGAMWQTGPEMQILDNDRHGDAVFPKHTAGSNYALHAPTMDVSRPGGSWNQARLIVNGNHVEHWLNGWKVVEYELGSEDWKAQLAASKFATTKGYGTQPEGHIGLQDHGDHVWFRNVKIRRLP